ncbi:hypothetical protein D1007_50290 [Hordeum vulgare]|nr:hypothetical protein D1007_50290 [Hordeum vulgare]
MDPFFHALRVVPFAFLQPPRTHLKAEAAVPDGRLLPHPSHLLCRRLRPRLRRHCPASRHRQLLGPGHLSRPPRRLPPRPRQRPVHHRGPLLRLHVPPRGRRDHPPRPGGRPHQAPQPARLLRRRRRRRHRHRLRHGHALPPHQDTRIPMVRPQNHLPSSLCPDPSSDLRMLKLLLMTLVYNLS